MRDSIKNTPFGRLKELVNSAPEELRVVLFANKSVPQRLDKHPEGNVLKHIMVVTMRALDQYPDDMDLILAAFFHDLGKYETADINPKTGYPNALGHEDISANYVEKYSDWVYDMGGRPDIVQDIVQDHMRVKNLDNMERKKQTDFYGKKNFDKIMKFSKLDKGGWFEPSLKEQLKKRLVSMLKEEEERYMFFSNLEQMKRQIELLLDLEKEYVEQTLDDNHDWAQDHIAVAKENIDQVFDFFMNEKEMQNESKDEGKKQLVEKNVPTNPSLWKKALSWARSRYKVCPSAYCNGAAAKRYKSMGGKWKTK